MTEQLNSIIIDKFNLLIKQIQREMADAQANNDLKEMKMHSFRLANMKKIVQIIKKLDFKIETSTDLKGMPGIGKGTLQRIDEIIDTGTLAELGDVDEVKEEQDETENWIKSLTEVIGIGEKYARKLIDDYGIKSVDELKKAIKKKKIAVNNKILLGLKYYGVVQGNIPRKEITSVEKYLRKKATELDESLEITICGSYRRGKKTSGDIDVLLYNPNVKLNKHVNNPEEYGFPLYLEDYVQSLSEDGFLVDHITDKNYHIKYMGFCQYKSNPVRRIDIRFVPYKSLPTAMLYFTGPYELNTIMRNKAIKQNMTLNEYGLYKIDKEGNKKPLKITSEKDVFDVLGMKYLSPTERENYNAGKNKPTKI